MKQYMVKGDGEYRTYVEVLHKDSRGYTVRMKKERSWGFKEETHTMSVQLFETCVRTGYFTAIESDAREQYA